MSNITPSGLPAGGTVTGTEAIPADQGGTTVKLTPNQITAAALAAASSAQTTANTANTNASSAVTTANAASSTAGTALTTANTANSAASAATTGLATTNATVASIQAQVNALVAALSLRSAPLSVSAIGDSITARMMGEFNTMDLSTNTTTASQNSTFKEYGCRAWLAYGAGRSNLSWFPYEYVAGGSGYTISQVLSTSLPALLTYPSGLPDICCILCGHNDAGALTPIATILPNYVSLITGLLNAGILPVICSLTPQVSPTNNLCAMYSAAFNELSRKYDLPFADFWTALANPLDGSWANANFTSDNTHPTPAGAMQMGAALNEGLQYLCRSKKLWWGQHDLGSSNTAVYSRDPNLMVVTGTVNSPSSYPTNWSAPATLALSTVWDSTSTESSTNGLTMWPGPLNNVSVGGAVTNWQGHTWMFQGDGTHGVNSSLSATITCSAGDRVAFMFSMKAVPDITATVGMGFRCCVTSASSNKIMGLGWAAQSITPVTGATLAPIGNDASGTPFPAYRFYFEMVIQPAQVGVLAIQFSLGTLNSLSASNAADKLFIANPRLVNLTTAGLI